MKVPSFIHSPGPWSIGVTRPVWHCKSNDRALPRPRRSRAATTANKATKLLPRLRLKRLQWLDTISLCVDQSKASPALAMLSRRFAAWCGCAVHEWSPPSPTITTADTHGGTRTRTHDAATPATARSARMRDSANDRHRCRAGFHANLITCKIDADDPSRKNLFIYYKSARSTLATQIQSGGTL